MTSKGRLFDKTKQRAETLVRKLGGKLSPASHDTLIAAVTEDLALESQAARVAEARIAKLETQVRVLAEALIALSDPKQNFVLALRAVKITCKTGPLAQE